MVQGLRMVFIFEYIVSVTSLLGYQTKQKDVVIKSGERKEICAFYIYCMIIWNSNWGRYTGKTVQKTKTILFHLILAFIIFCKPEIYEGVSTMSGWWVSILFYTLHLNIEIQFLTMLEATVYSETPETLNAWVKEAFIDFLKKSAWP